MSAHDSAMLTRKLMRTYPIILDITSTPEYTIHKGTNNEKVIKNTNYMLPGLKHEYTGVQGVKTGSTRAAGYCFAGTVKRTGVRLISVVMGAESDDKRFTETAKLYDHVYKFFKPITLLHAGESIPALKNVVVADAATNKVPIGLKEDLNVVAKNGDQQKFTYQPHLKSNLKAPLKKGEEVGTVDVLYNGKKVEGLEPMKLVVKQDVERINPFEKLLKKMAAAM
jgi:D-alanyl-D-alanine carboxypeptidase (penicillin-binding protein 5/6)